MNSFTISAARIKEAYLYALETGTSPLDRKYGDEPGLSEALHFPDNHSGFLGATPREIGDRLKRGHKPTHTSSITGSTFGDQEIFQSNIFINDEDGDMLIESVLGGEDLYYCKYDPMPTTAGATLRIMWNTLADSSAECLNAYYDWCLSVIESLKNRGMAPTVELKILNRGCVDIPGSKDDLVEIIIPLTTGGMIVDSVAWRAFLAPGAYRTLGFLSHGLLAEDLNSHVNYSHGSSVGHAFAVAYDQASGVVDIACPRSMPAVFPVEEMEAQLDRVLNRTAV
jgi:hypothetical protein